jgi:hypothetical protein
VARPPFLVSGTAVALVATLWGGTIWLRGVEEPSAAAVEAYARGQAKLDVVTFDANADRADYDGIVDEMTRAIRARPDFREAYLARGSAYFNYDLAVRPEGPQGSPEARDDFRAAVELDPDDSIAWLDLGAAQFWLDDYPSALESTRRALDLKYDDPIANLNYALFFIANENETGYARQIRRARVVMASIPSWLRNAVMIRYQVVIDRGLEHRPAIADAIRRLREDLLRMVHEIEVSNQVNGTPDPPSVAAAIETPQFSLSADQVTLEVRFTYTGMEAGQPWLYRTYVDGVRNDNFSIASQPFDDSRFDVPDGGIVLTFTDQDGFRAGQVIRVEVFVEGNLLAAGELTVP